MSIKIKYEGKSDEKFLDKLGSNKVGGSGGGGGSSAPSDWNAYEGEPGHVLNRTHYEEVTTVGGDTLTWDGNTEGLLSVSISGGAMAFKVSDLTPSPDEMPNGLVFRMSSGSEQEMPKEVVQGSFDAYGAIIGGMFIIYSDNHTFEGMATFPKAGIYFSVIEDEYGFERAVSLTIPGYTGFTTTTTEIKTLDPKYLPEALQFGEEIVEITVIDNQTFEFDTSNEEWAYFEDIVPAPVTTVEGWLSADVTIDGVTYKNIHVDKQVDVVFFLIEDESVYFDIGMWVEEGEFYLSIGTSNTSNSHTISIVVYAENIHYIRRKYIKDMYGSDLTEVVSGSITNIAWGENPWDGAVSAEYSDGIYEWLNNMIPKAAPDGAGNEGYGESYNVVKLTINGKTRWINEDYAAMYAWVDWNNGDGIAFFQVEDFWGGAIQLYEGKLNCSQVNAGCIELFGLTSADEVTDIEFTIYNGAFKRIDEKYIPDTIARMSDVETLITGAIGGSY